MTPSELLSALEVLDWSNHDLARRIDVDYRTVRRWAMGTVPVPERVAAWLSGMARIVAAAGAVPPPETGDGGR